MASFLLAYAGLMGCFFIFQGISILRMGNMRGIFAGLRPAPDPRAKPKSAMVVGCAGMYLGSGVALNSVVVVALLKRHIISSTLPQPKLSSLPHLMGPLFLVGVSFWALVKPSGMLGWVKQSSPSIDVNDAFARMIVRVCAAGCLAIGLVLLYAFT